MCTFIIPDVSNNVQTREMNKFFSKSWCVSWGRPSRWLKSESKTKVTMNKTLHRLGTFLSEASGGFSSAVLFVWLCGRHSVTSEWVCLQDQQQDYFCCTSAANQQWAAQDVCLCLSSGRSLNSALTRDSGSLSSVPLSSLQHNAHEVKCSSRQRRIPAAVWLIKSSEDKVTCELSSRQYTAPDQSRIWWDSRCLFLQEVVALIPTLWPALYSTLCKHLLSVFTESPLLADVTCLCLIETYKLPARRPKLVLIFRLAATD